MSQCFEHNLHISSESPRMDRQTDRQTAVWSPKQGTAAWHVPAKPGHSAQIRHPRPAPTSLFSSKVPSALPLDLGFGRSPRRSRQGAVVSTRGLPGAAGCRAAA